MLSGSPLRVHALRHIPDGRDPRDFGLAGLSATNRWNDPGTPTVYLGADRGVCAAEYARHLRGSPLGREGRLHRAVYDYEVVLGSVLDLRENSITTTLAVEDAPTAFLDRSICRRLAREARAGDPRLCALLVPSVAFLDDPERWTLVVYLDRIDPDVAFPNVRRIGELEYREGRSRDARSLLRRVASRLRRLFSK